MLFTLLHKILQTESVKDDKTTGIITTQNSNEKRAVERQSWFIWFPSINCLFRNFGVNHNYGVNGGVTGMRNRLCGIHVFASAQFLYFSTSPKNVLFLDLKNLGLYSNCGWTRKEM
jgi:hypothetical protein